VKAKRLFDLNLSTVGLVPAGADQDAHIVLAKSAPTAQEDGMAKTDDLIEAVKNLGDDDKAALVAAITKVDETVAADPAPAANADEVVKNDEVPAVTPAAESTTTPVVVEVPAVKAEEQHVAEEPVVAKADTESVVSKADFETVRKALEETRAELAAQREAVEIRDTVEAVRKSFPQLGTDADAIGAAKYRMSKGVGTAEDIELVMTVLGKLYSAVQESSLFAEFGSAQDGSADPNSVIEREAAELRKSDPSLTYPQSIAKAVAGGKGRSAYAESLR